MGRFLHWISILVGWVSRKRELGMRLFFRPFSAPQWLDDVLNSVRGALSDEWPTPLKLQSFTVAGVPPAADWAGGMIYVSNEVGGAVPAFSDGTNWRRVTDRAIIA